MTELVGVSAEALDEVIRYLRAHADFKRGGHGSYPSVAAAEKIDGYADALEAVRIPLDIRVQPGPASCSVGQHHYSEDEGLCIWCGQPQEPPEPPRPVDCDNCGTTYKACTSRIRRGQRACCGECVFREAHRQMAWENWDRARRCS